MDSSKLLLAGSGCESTSATIEMSKTMAAEGADCLLVVTPSFFKGKMDSSACKFMKILKKVLNMKYPLLKCI